jgi:hypothetical protein
MSATGMRFFPWFLALVGLAILLITLLLFFKKLDLKGEHISLSRSPSRITQVIDATT